MERPENTVTLLHFSAEYPELVVSLNRSPAVESRDEFAACADLWYVKCKFCGISISHHEADHIAASRHGSNATVYNIGTDCPGFLL